MIAKEKSALIRRELQEIVILTSQKSYGTILNSFSRPQSGEEQDVLNKIHNAVRDGLTSKGDHLFSSFGIITP
ncbi:MAG: hypothetical protein ACI9IJ_001065 [Psychromonas sp.]|jgi:hypothetical protein